MSLVLDASVALAWFFEDEADAYASSIESRVTLTGCVVPWIWPVEVVNALAMAERRGRITAAKVDGHLDAMRVLPVKIESERASNVRLIELCRRHQRTAYDALYLDLAQREGLPLATLDRGLRQACVEAGVEVLTG